jgi:hypothetical protein
MPVCRRLLDIPNPGKALSNREFQVLTFWVIKGKPGLWSVVKGCKADAETEPGQVLAVREHPTGTQDGFYILERLAFSDVIINGKW